MIDPVARAALGAAALLATLLPTLPAHAESWILLKGHAGTERREDLQWRGFTVGLYTSSASGDEWFPLGENLTRFVNLEGANLGLEFTFASIDDRTFRRVRYDLSVVPKLHYYLTEHWYWSFGAGIGYNALEEENGGENDLRLGGKLFYAPEASFGYRFDVGGTPLLAELLYSHLSNAGQGDQNQSLNFFLLALSTRFHTGP